MMLLNRRVRYSKRLLWLLLAAIVASALWVLKVELAYERNVRHLPAEFHLRQHSRVYNWKA